MRIFFFFTFILILNGCATIEVAKGYPKSQVALKHLLKKSLEKMKKKKKLKKKKKNQ